MKVGQHVVLGRQWGKVRAMKDAQGASLQEAFPGTPVEISGLRGMPMAGDDFLVQPRCRPPPPSPQKRHCHALLRVHFITPQPFEV